MADVINWAAPLHAPTKPGKYVCRNGEVVELTVSTIGKEWIGTLSHRQKPTAWGWTGSYMFSEPYTLDIIGEYVEPPPDERWAAVGEQGDSSVGYHTRERAEREAILTSSPVIKRYVLAEIINLNDDNSGENT